MLQSEQLDTRLVLAANDQVAAGLLIQRLPIKGEANLLVMPQAHSYGRLTPDEAPDVVADHLAGLLTLPHYRGHCTVPWPEQAAEHALRERLGLREVDAVRVQRLRRDGTLFWCHVVGRALDRAQPFARAVWMFEDISHRRVVSTPLTVREREVAQHIVTGATSKQIARHLNISHRTVEAHRGRLMRKLGATSTGELVALLLGMP